MKPIILALTVALTLSGCASFETAMRDSRIGLDSGAGHDLVEAQKAEPKADPYDVTGVEVTVPETLKVSEANSFFPFADIVWREDPPGDRYAQVRKIVQDAADEAVGPFDSGHKVKLSIELTRFHALTQKTRYSFGGTHDIRFRLTVSDATSGEVLEGPRIVRLRFEAYGGQKALDAERAGQTQKVRITDHLIKGLRKALAAHGKPEAGAPMQLSSLIPRLRGADTEN